MKVKICGIRTLEAAKAAEAAGADLIGFVFADSRRRIAPAQAAQISGEIQKCKTVGVFVDADSQYVNEIARLVGLDYVQLHGSEDAGYIDSIKQPVIKAFRWGDDFSLEAVHACPAKFILLDSFLPGQKGGTGKKIPWQEAAPTLQHLKRPFFLAGGISVENVQMAAEIFAPFGIDVSGGVEENGEKSGVKIKQFMDVAKSLK
jgi:phosphoribosylanthranilate isomerase